MLKFFFNSKKKVSFVSQKLKNQIKKNIFLRHFNSLCENANKNFKIT